jgi:ribonuclease P protein component
VTPRLRLPRTARIRDDDTLVALRATGRVRGRWFVVSARANAMPHSRLAVRVAKRVVKSAVVRNRVRRCVKEVFRQQRPAFEPADFLVSLIHPYREQTLRAAREELERLLRSARPDVSPGRPGTKTID